MFRFNVQRQPMRNVIPFNRFLIANYMFKVNTKNAKNKVWKMFKDTRNNNKDTRKTPPNCVILVSLLLTLNIFHTLCKCFYCWISTCNCRLGLTLLALWFSQALKFCNYCITTTTKTLTRDSIFTTQRQAIFVLLRKKTF